MATKQIAWQTGSGNITLTYTGQGNGTIQVSSDPNNLGSARSQVITVETTQGGVVTKNLTINQAACPVPVGTILNYAYTGNYQEVELPAGQYKLQCWGAQGGSNGTNSTYGITAKAGGKGGYSEGIITLSQKTTVRVYVGGQGSSSAGGFNGGGSTTGTSQYNSGDEFGISKMGGGGGATDIRLSDGALLSRMIVAGGGSGGAMCYQSKTTTSWETVAAFDLSSAAYDNVNHFNQISSVGNKTYIYNGYLNTSYNNWYQLGITQQAGTGDNYFGLSVGDVIKVSTSSTVNQILLGTYNTQASFTFENGNYTFKNSTSSVEWTLNKTTSSLGLTLMVRNATEFHGTVTLSVKRTSTSTNNYSQVGYVGGGTTGNGYSSTYKGKQNGAGSGGAFGQGANQTASAYRYCSGAGGAGWYGGGGGQYSDSSTTYCQYSGGGSGFVNTAASAGNRPSGYTGLQLDSGSTTAGSSSFPAPGGGNETGHSGNGYARITRLS